MDMNKRDAVMSLLDQSQAPAFTPAAFFLHFDPSEHFGPAAVAKHLEYFRFTGMDFVKIQYERTFPTVAAIQRPEDWSKMPFYGLDFYQEQLGVVEGLVKAAKKDALIILTLYSPFMCAHHTLARELSLEEHILDNPEAVKKGMQTITDSLMGFIREAVRLGVDGFYHSTQGGEHGRFETVEPFDECIRPYDLALMQEIDRTCIFNILHVCDYNLPYKDLSQFRDYPGHIVNTNLELVDRTMTPPEVEQLFGRPFMGGLDRHGVLAHGSVEQVRQAAEAVLDAAPQRFILGADCTVPSDTPWENLRAAIDAAHKRHNE
jgi:uroporphyrinogen decarboxylase